MVSPELIRRFSFFAGLDASEVSELAKLADAYDARQGTVIFHEQEELECLYLVVSGEVGIVLQVTARDVSHGVSAQLTGDMEMEDVIVSSAKEGEIFGWSSLIPPHKATAGAKVFSDDASLVMVDALALRKRFDDQPHFGYKMAVKIAQVARQRLQDIRIESLSERNEG